MKQVNRRRECGSDPSGILITDIASAGGNRPLNGSQLEADQGSHARSSTALAPDVSHTRGTPDLAPCSVRFPDDTCNLTPGRPFRIRVQ